MKFALLSVECADTWETFSLFMGDFDLGKIRGGNSFSSRFFGLMHAVKGLLIDLFFSVNSDLNKVECCCQFAGPFTGENCEPNRKFLLREPVRGAFRLAILRRLSRRGWRAGFAGVIRTVTRRPFLIWQRI